MKGEKIHFSVFLCCQKSHHISCNFFMWLLIWTISQFLDIVYLMFFSALFLVAGVIFGDEGAVVNFSAANRLVGLVAKSVIFLRMAGFFAATLVASEMSLVRS
mgnify:CR=1 FL=1